MNLSELQAELRRFAAERDWQPFHTPKNLTTALLVEAAELAEIFQWMTPEESWLAPRDAGLKQRIGDEVADVLLYLLQVADHSEIDLAKAVSSKLARNALKYPPKRSIARVSPARADTPGTHVRRDDENVQPTVVELRALVPDASQLWVFHGPHQRQVGHGQVMPAAAEMAVSAATPAAKKVPARKAAAKPPAVKRAPAKKVAVAVQAVAAKPAASAAKGATAAALSPDSAAASQKLTDSLRKMGDKRPATMASLTRSLKSFLGLGATDTSVEVALMRLIKDGVVTVAPVTGASYPGFDAQRRSTVRKG